MNYLLKSAQEREKEKERERGTPSSSLSRRIFFKATNLPVALCLAFKTSKKYSVKEDLLCKQCHKSFLQSFQSLYNHL